jgi:hypothetical protein
MLLTVSEKHWTNFAVNLVKTGEIDPPYEVIYKGGLSYGDEWAERFALHYFLFYDLGGAARCANDTTPFWSYVTNGYHLFKRGKSRRHFRGENGARAIRLLLEYPTAGDVFAALYQPTYAGMYHHIQDNFDGCQIGDYFRWKLMDIFDRCLGRHVSLSMPEALKFLPETPRKGAKQFFPNDSLTTALMSVVRTISHLPAPGNPNRPCDLPEAETILCAMYGARKGTYRFGMDLDHRREELKDFPDLVEFLPTHQDWSPYDCSNLES